MSRWGEEEKKTKGLWGCSFAFILLGLTLYIFIINYQNLEGRRQLEKAMQDVIRTGTNKSEREMVAEIEQAMIDLNLDLGIENIELYKSYDDYGNAVVDCAIDFNFTVNVLVAEFPVAIPIKEEVTIVDF